MIMDLYPEDARAGASTFGEAAPAAPPTFGESMDIAYQNATRFGNSIAQHRARQEAYEKQADDFYKASGQRIVGPASPFARATFDRSGKFDGYRGQGGNLRKAVDEWNEKNPERLFVLPAGEDIARQGEDISKAARKNEQELDLRGGGGVGGFIGSAGGAMVDPFNVASMPFGGSGSLARIFLKETAIGLAATAGSEAAGFAYKQKIDPKYSLGEAAENVVFGGLTQGVFATGLAAGIRGLAVAFNRTRGVADPMARDAGNVTMGDAHIETFDRTRTPQGNAAHVEASREAIQAVREERQMRLSPEMEFEWNARNGRVYDAENRPIDVRYELVNERDLITSHTRDFRENPDFPQEFQPRDRGRAMSQAQVNDIASNLVPERLGPSMDASTGAPIVSAGGIVESGNGRVMALRQAFDGDGPQAANYRAWLQRMGFDPDQYERPVLIARRISDLDDAQRSRFVRAAQSSGTLNMSPAERALSDAKLLNDRIFAKLNPGQVTSAANRDFVRDFAKLLPKGDQGSLYDAKGALSIDGQRRIQAALMARAWDEHTFLTRVLEDTDNNIKSIGGAFSDASGEMAKLRSAIARGEVPAQMDISGDFLEALRLVMKARDEGRPIREIVSQGDLLFEASPMQQVLLKAMFRDDEFKRPLARSKLAEIIDDYAREAQKVSDSPMLLDEPLSPSQIVQGSMERAGRNDLFAMMESQIDTNRIRADMGKPDAIDATVHEAYRIANENGDSIKVQFEGPDGKMVERSAADALMELDDMAAAAKELQMCALGREAAE